MISHPRFYVRVYVFNDREGTDRPKRLHWGEKIMGKYMSRLVFVNAR